MGQTITVVTGNSDNKLSQQEWSALCADIDRAVDHACKWQGRGFTVHGKFHSLPNVAFQNACWLFEASAALPDWVLERMRRRLAGVCRDYGQDGIAWISGTTEFVTALPHAEPAAR